MAIQPASKLGITSRIDAITGLTPAYSMPAPPCPRSVKIELTARCNYACSFCARSMRLRDQKDMDRALYHRLALEMRETGVEELGLFYLGESFLIPWLPDAIAYAKGVGYPYVFLTTNGSLPTPQRVRDCMEAGLDSLKFSFNYATAKQLSEITRVKESYFDVMKHNIKEACRVREAGGYRTGLYASYILYDGEQGERMKEAIADIAPYVDEVYALPLYNQADLVTASEQEKGWKPTPGNRGRVGALREPLPCWSLFSEGHVTWDGKLSACCFDHDGRFHMGDLTKQGFMDAWHSATFQELRAAHLRRDVKGTVCEKCVVFN